MSLQNITLSQGAGIPAVGTILKLGNLGSPQVYNPIGNAGTQKWTLKTKSADTTNMGTAWTQSIPTLLDGGTYTVQTYFVPGSAGVDGTTGIEGHSFSSGLGYIYQNRQIRQFQLVFPDGTVELFSAYILDFTLSESVDKTLVLDMTLQVTGQPTFI